MAHYVFNVPAGERDRALALLAANRWSVGRDEVHRRELARGDHALIYLAPPAATFIGRADVASPVDERTSSDTEGETGERPSDVSLRDVETWEPGVPMDAVVRRIDPTGSNPLVQANAAAGFRMGVVRITDDEYAAALAVARDVGAT